MRRRGAEIATDLTLIHFPSNINKFYTWYYPYLKVPLARFRIHQSDVLTRIPTTAHSPQKWWIKWTRSVKNSTGLLWSMEIIGRQNLQNSCVGVPGKLVGWSSVCLEWTMEVMTYACLHTRAIVHAHPCNTVSKAVNLVIIFVKRLSFDFLFPSPMLFFWNSHQNNVSFGFVLLTVVISLVLRGKPSLLLSISTGECWGAPHADQVFNKHGQAPYDKCFYNFNTSCSAGMDACAGGNDTNYVFSISDIPSKFKIGRREKRLVHSYRISNIVGPVRSITGGHWT